MTRQSRNEKEQLLIRKGAELQRVWGNPLDDDSKVSKIISELSDEELDKHLEDTIGQLRFEKVWNSIAVVAKTAVIIFVTLGVIGLLLFGVRQLL